MNRLDTYWHGLSGNEKHRSQTAKVADMRVPILRVISKMPTYSFFHRATQNDKAYAEDLWILSYFDEGDVEKYVNVPWALVCFMEKKGAGRQSDSQMCCGHFITKIARSLGLYTTTNTKQCSPAVQYKHITKHDLETSKLLNPSGTKLIPEGERPAGSQGGQPQARRGGNQMLEMLTRIEGKIDRQNEYLAYHVQRYQPVWERMLQEGEPGAGLPVYAPPVLVEVPQEEAESSSGEEEGGEDSHEE